MGRLAREVERGVCHSEDFSIDDVDCFRTKGIDTWFYGPMIYEQKTTGGCGSNTFIDLDLLVNRGIGWGGWKYRTGWGEWGFDLNAYAGWFGAENYKGSPDRIFYGSGPLISCRPGMGYLHPISSTPPKAQP